MGLIGMELTFFIIARVVLCFRLVTKKIITPMFQLPLNNACIVSRPPLSLILSIPESRLRVGKRLGGGLSWDSWPSCPKGYSITYNAMLSNKRVGRVGEAGGMVVVVPKVAIAWRLAGHHSPDGCGKWLPLPHLCCFSFLALLNGLYFGPWFFLTFSLLILSPTSSWGEEREQLVGNLPASHSQPTTMQKPSI